MQYDAELVEYVVREVIRRLTADGRFAPRATATSATITRNETRQRELNVADRLVTLATLHGKLDGVTQLTIARRAVITPAVRDELKQRKIELKRDE